MTQELGAVTEAVQAEKDRLKELNVHEVQMKHKISSKEEKISKLTLQHNNKMAAATDNLKQLQQSVSFFFSPRFSRHVGSPVSLMILLLHITLSVFSPALSVRHFSSLVGTRFSIVFSVVLSSFSWYIRTQHFRRFAFDRCVVYDRVCCRERGLMCS